MARLEREQEELLGELVEAHRRVPRGERDKFFLVSTFGGDSVIHPGLHGWELTTNSADVEMLGRYALLDLDYSGKSLRFAVTPEGLEHYESLKQAGAGRIEQVAEEIVRYLSGETFQTRHPAAAAKWAAADTDLWSSESGQELTTIGHNIREAMQLFATELLTLHPAESADPDPQHIVARVRAVLDQAQPKLGDTEPAFLHALLAYWGTVSDLAQRQEHGAQRENESLNWEDSRRLVFQSAVVMYEVDRAVSRAFEG